MSAFLFVSILYYTNLLKLLIMKTLLLFCVFMFCNSLAFTSFSQTVYKLDAVKVYYWDDTSDPVGWEQQLTQNYTYANGGNKETNVLALSFPESYKTYQYNKSYNSNNDIILSTIQYWNDSSMKWEDAVQQVYTYFSGTSHVKDITTYNYSLGYSTYKILYEYLGNDVIKMTTQKGDAGGLVNEEKYDYTYTSGIPTTEVESGWNGGAWEQKELSVATYATDKRTVEVFKYVGGNWASNPFERYITTYSGTLEMEYLWQTYQDGDWINEDLEVNEYDANGNKIVYTDSTWVDSDWEPDYRELSSYSVAAPLSTESFNSENFKIFPNPASDVINIMARGTIDKIEMFNVLGENVLTTFRTKTLNVENFNSGIYMLNVYSNNQSVSKKIVIK